jgi:hypothetical protein
MVFEQTPAFRKIVGLDNAARREIKALATKRNFWLHAPGFCAVSKKVGTRNLALDNDGTALPFPANRVGHFAAGALLFRKDDSAAIPAQPLLGHLNQLRVSHTRVVEQIGFGKEVLNRRRQGHGKGNADIPASSMCRDASSIPQ